MEQTTPGAFSVTDQNSTAEDLVFDDLDLDFDEMGGPLSQYDAIQYNTIQDNTIQSKKIK